MHVEIYPLRRNGFRIPSNEHGRGEPMRGTLIITDYRLSETKLRRAAVLRKYGTFWGPKEHILAVLFDPEIKTLDGARFLLSGWELVEWKEHGRQVVLQEWPCQVLGF